MPDFLACLQKIFLNKNLTFKSFRFIMSECLGRNNEMSTEILVVDDHPEIADFACKSIRDWGYTARAFKSAAEALAFLNENQGVRVIITDLHMPGTDGLQLAQTVRNSRPQVKLILMTTEDLPAEELAQAGFCGQHVKGTDPQNLRKLLYEHLLAGRQFPQ